MIREYYTILALLTNNEHLLESGRMDFFGNRIGKTSLSSRIGILMMNQDRIFMVKHYIHPRLGLRLLDETLDQIL